MGGTTGTTRSIYSMSKWFTWTSMIARGWSNPYVNQKPANGRKTQMPKSLQSVWKNCSLLMMDSNSNPLRLLTRLLPVQLHRFRKRVQEEHPELPNHFDFKVMIPRGILT